MVRIREATYHRECDVADTPASPRQSNMGGVGGDDLSDCARAAVPRPTRRSSRGAQPHSPMPFLKTEWNGQRGTRATQLGTGVVRSAPRRKVWRVRFGLVAVLSPR